LYSETKPFCTEPKFVPVMVNCIPGDTADGEIPVTVGAWEKARIGQQRSVNCNTSRRFRDFTIPPGLCLE
jgi:hypothetical protein